MAVLAPFRLQIRGTAVQGPSGHPMEHSKFHAHAKADAILRYIVLTSFV